MVAPTDQLLHAADSRASGRRRIRPCGVENRTCALRVIPGSAKSQRVEYRVAAADANPYVILAAALALGTVRASSNASSPSRSSKATPTTTSFPNALALPRTLWDVGAAPEAVARWRASGSATPSSSTSPRRANGKSASSASTSPIGSWRGTSRSSDVMRGCEPDLSPISSHCQSHCPCSNHLPHRRQCLRRASARDAGGDRPRARPRARGAARVAQRRRSRSVHASSTASAMRSKRSATRSRAS